MMNHYQIEENRLIQSTRGIGPVLIAVSPDDREKEFLQERFLIDDYDLNSTLDPDEVPRIDLTGGRLFLIWKLPQSATVSEAVELNVDVAGLTFFQDSLAFVRANGDLSFTDREFRKISDVKDVMLAFLLRTVRHFVGHLKVIKNISSELEKKITVSMENKHLLQMFNLGESLVYYVDAIQANGVVLTKLRSICPQLGFQDRHIELLEDIILENNQAARQAAIYSSVLGGLMDARGNIVNNNMNVLLKNLTLINIVFLPLNLIASMGGMSEFTMMTEGFDWRLSYGLFSLGIVVLGWGTWLFMKKIIDKRPARIHKRLEEASADRRSTRQFS